MRIIIRPLGGCDEVVSGGRLDLREIENSGFLFYVREVI